jgi:hypothetical protein
MTLEQEIPCVVPNGRRAEFTRTSRRWFPPRADIVLDDGLRTRSADDNGIRFHTNRIGERRIDENELRADRAQFLGARTDKPE